MRSSHPVVGGDDDGGQPPERFGGFVKRDLAIIRAVEAVVALVLVLVLYHWVSAGALTSLGRSMTGWYSDKVDGLFTISVIDTSIRLPNLDRANFPIASAPESNTEVSTVANT